jgi:hypothetical protein
MHCGAHGLRREGLLLQRIQFDPAEEHFSAFGLEQDFAAGGKCFGAFVGQFSVDELLDVISLRDQFQ